MTFGRISGRVVLTTAALVALAGCIDRLPDQDRRILAAAPIAKMPVEDLWKDYQQDRNAAERRYWGHAVDVSGRVAETTQVPPAGSVLSFDDKSGAVIVEAVLLDDQAQTTVAGLGEDRRITLRCFCDRYAGHVVLKSCIRP